MDSPNKLVSLITAKTTVAHLSPQTNETDTRRALLSHDGYQRETALCALTSQPIAVFIPHILERLNDWVPQVRVRAEEALRAHLKPEFLEGWIDAVPAVCRLARYRRAPHAISVANVQTYFDAMCASDWLAARLHLFDPETAGFLFDVSCNSEREMPAALTQAALSLPQRTIALKALSRVLEDESLRDEAIQTAFRSTNPMMRADAIRVAMRWRVAASDSMVVEALSDPSSRVRSVAVFFAKDIPVANEKLVGAIAQTADVPLLLLGLNALQRTDRAGVVRLRDLTQHTSAVVRAQAWLALLRVDAPRAREHFAALLADRSSKVRHIGLNALRKARAPLDRVWAEAMCESAQAYSTRHANYVYVALLKALRGEGAWEQLAFALRFESADQCQIDVFGRMQGFYGQWLARNGSLAFAPSPVLRTLIDSRLLLQTNRLIVELLQRKLRECVALR